MKVINMIDSSSKVASASLIELKKTEKELGAIFPEEYKELFLETNGAKFGEWTLFPIPPIDLSEFTFDIVKRNRDKRPKNLPSDMICIGEKMNGDILCYRIRKRFMQEQIYLWNNKTGISDCKASTLSQFIDWYVPRAGIKKPKTVGTFSVESGKLIVTDPYFQVDNENEMQILLSNVKKGNWTTTISYSHEDVVENLFVFYGEQKPKGKWHDCDKLVGVDSAQAGIFDLTAFGRDAKYYLACCDIVASDAHGGVVPSGAVSMSGYGDGMYEVKVKYNVSKEVVGVMIDFR
ncbi:SMI1/KNR4 family protein [Metabacillus idriensis]|uniref:SMI1/KNR4 family protein n=1 Tax=Metabacillus idriensis TaxID=324768 RepID=UPI0020404782|nr:SMI1/KNR4 family protein [Metabacillus idriensis]MCM3597212.1 SMI1/KNR4 family protein [Metabacillus idriensis]